MRIEFFVPGLCATQGSKDQFGRESCKHLKDWRSAVRFAASQQMRGNPPVSGPVRVHYYFCFARPKNHFRTGKNSDLLREDAPMFACEKGDLDKLQRAANDAMTQVVYQDDKQISVAIATKGYGIQPGVEIIITSLEEENHVQFREPSIPEASANSEATTSAHPV